MSKKEQALFHDLKTHSLSRTAPRSKAQFAGAAQ